MAAPVIQFKRGAWQDLPGLSIGEPGFTTDTSELYIGSNGTLGGNKFFGSSRYWGRESTSNGGSVRVYESTSNGSNFIALRAPSNIPSNVNYILPESPIDGYFLKSNSLGVLSWSNQFDNIILTGTIQNQGNVNISGNLSVENNLTVYGSSITFDVDSFDIGSRILNIGIQTNSPSDTIWDSGVVFNYFKSGTRYRSGIFWDDSSGRIGLASHIPTIFNEVGSSYNSPIIDTSSLTWAPLEIGSLWVNDCAGQSEVIACSGSERTLENISIDGGFY